MAGVPLNACILSTTEVFTMYALVCLSLLASAFAAPQYSWPPPPPPQYYGPPPPPPPPHHHHHHHHDHDSGLNEFIGDGVFDTRRFYSELSNEMSRFDQMMEEFMKHFPKSESTSGVQGNQYKINIVLDGFNEKEITVKAREGLVMVQAVHKTENDGERNYLDVRTLPSFVIAGSGSWTYEGTLLKIVFPLTEDSISTTEATTEFLETAVPTESETQEPDREEMESHETDNISQDADVGVRGDTEILTNEIPQGKPEETEAEVVETTTYAVDFKNDVEFVPVQIQ